MGAFFLSSRLDAPNMNDDVIGHRQEQGPPLELFLNDRYLYTLIVTIPYKEEL